ncbi:MAG: class B sortase [Bacilli bacterium]|nr:class B sortase [Bacilli bacterium]
MKKWTIISSLCVILLLCNITVFGYTEESYLNLINSLENAKTSFDFAIKKVEEKNEEEKLEELKRQEELKRLEELKQQEELKKQNAKKTLKNEEKKKSLTNVEIKAVNNIESKKEITYDNRLQVSNIINSKLMKDTTGDNYYLNHSITGVEDGIGVPYIDYRTDFNMRKTIIYGHSSKTLNAPFQALQKYHNNYNFYKNNKYITINYNGKTYKYEIFSVYVAVAQDRYSDELEYFYKMNYSNSKWEETINLYKSKSQYDTGVSVNKDDKILILQTCSMDDQYYHKYYRANLLIFAKLI